MFSAPMSLLTSSVFFTLTLLSCAILSLLYIVCSFYLDCFYVHMRIDSSKNEHETTKSSLWLHQSSYSFQSLLDIYFRHPVLRTVMAITHISANYPTTTVVACIAISFILAVAGYLTNFNLTVEFKTCFTPIHSRVAQHRDWIYYDSNFPQERKVVMVLHANGENACAQPVKALDKIFDAVDAIRDLPEYSSVCPVSNEDEGKNNDDGAVDACEMLSVTGFWGDSSDIYQQQVQGDADIARKAMSADSLRNDFPVAENLIFGHVVRDNTTDLIEFCESFTTSIRLPETDAAYEFETDVLAAVLELDDMWANEPNNNLRMAINVKRSFGDE